MAKAAKNLETDPLQLLINKTYLFRDLDSKMLSLYLTPEDLKLETLFSNRPVYTAFLPDEHLDSLYVVVEQGLVISRSTPLDRVIALTYPGGCFGMHNLPFSYGLAARAFPTLVEAYKTTQVIKIPLEILQRLYQDSELIQERYRLLFELRAKFHYHLLNCSTYPPQAVAALLRALIYQERSLGNQPHQGIYTFDLPVDLIARACQLNQRTVEQVLKGMQQVKLINLAKEKESSEDSIDVLDPEGLKGVYSATRDKVSWWPLK
jgi:hypothetical protein